MRHIGRALLYFAALRSAAFCGTLPSKAALVNEKCRTPNRLRELMNFRKCGTRALLLLNQEKYEKRRKKEVLAEYRDSKLKVPQL